jgi:hypothetical protein
MTLAEADAALRVHHYAEKLESDRERYVEM